MGLTGPRNNLSLIKRPGVTIDVLDDGGTTVAVLLPVCDLGKLDDDLIEKITFWRTRARMFFRTQFVGTTQGTRGWIQSTVIPSPDRVLFLVCVEGRVVGHYGLCNITSSSAELDNAIRGERGGGLICLILLNGR